MERKGLTGLWAVFVAAVFALSGCSKNQVVNYQESQEDTISITFFGNKYEPENVIVIEDILSGFMEENPGIRVSYESLKGVEYYDALVKRMAAGKGDDVFMVNHDVALDLVEKGQLADLSKLDTIPEFTDQMISQMKQDDKIYWVPTTVSAFGLYCNMDLLEEHGQKIPENLREWEQVNSYFVENGITPVIANNDISLKTLAIGLGFYPFYQENRQKEVFERLNRGEEKLSSYLTQGFALAESFIEKGYINGEKAFATKKTSDDLEEFVKGEAPFMLTGAWAAGRVENMKPDFEFSVAPYPALEDGGFVVINADTRLSVNADSKHKDAALKFVEYFTREGNIQRFADQQSSFSPLKGGEPSSVLLNQPLFSCYQSGRIVIGTDSYLEIPIWDVTAKVSEKLLQGEPLEAVMEWMDSQTKGGSRDRK